jgi:hypothetical protein
VQPLTATHSKQQYPPPPNLRWYWLLVLSFLTAGIFYEVWMVILSVWLLKLSRGWKEWIVLGCFVTTALLALFNFGLAFQAAHYHVSIRTIFFPYEPKMQDWGPLPAVIGIFLMRNSLQRHFNEHWPIALTLNPIMTFFFQGLYVQYHLSEVADFMRGETASLSLL